MKKMNAELQRFQMSLEMEGRKRQFEKAMNQQKEALDNDEAVPPLISLDNMR